MGYGYGRSASGRMVLACDCCGSLDGVRKRKCTFIVDGLPYCPAPAYCAACFKEAGGSKKIHAGCEVGARVAQARYDAERARLEAGGLRVRAAYGSWHETVPEGYAGVTFAGLDGAEVCGLVEITEYQARGVDSFYDDFTVLPWCGPLGGTESDDGPLVRVGVPA